MATTTEVKSGLDTISQIITTERNAAKNAKARLSAAKQLLAAIPTNYSDVLAEINGYTPTGAFETLSKDELAKLTTEFQALQSAITTAETALAAITEF